MTVEAALMADDAYPDDFKDWSQEDRKRALRRESAQIPRTPEPRRLSPRASQDRARSHRPRRTKRPKAERRRRASRAANWQEIDERPNFRTLKEFCAEFLPISYAVAGLMRDGSLYTLTGRTGEGKTAFLVLLALAIATGRSELIGRRVKKGRVAFATAENPDDLRMRLMVACFVFNIDVDVIDRDILISDNRVRPEAITAGSRRPAKPSP